MALTNVPIALSDRLASPEASEVPPEVKAHATRGERGFDWLTYGGLAGLGTFALSVGSMYLMKFGEGRAGFGLSSRSWKQEWNHLAERFAQASAWKSLAKTKLGQTKMFAFLHDDHALQRTAQRLLETTALGLIGGTVIMFPVEGMERRKKSIVHALNEKIGAEGETELGDLHVKNEPPQTIGTLVKGRMTAFAVGFASLMTADILLSKGAKAALKPESSMAVKELAENGLGALSRWSGEGVGKLHRRLAPNASPERNLFWKRMGDISAVDLIATVASTAILYVSSKFYSRKLSERTGLKAAAEQGGISVKENDAVPVKEKDVEPVREANAPPTQEEIAPLFAERHETRKKKEFATRDRLPVPREALRAERKEKDSRPEQEGGDYRAQRKAERKAEREDVLGLGLGL